MRAFRHGPSHMHQVRGICTTAAIAIVAQGCSAGVAPLSTGSISPPSATTRTAQQTDCPSEAPSGKAMSVESMLSSARAAQENGKTPSASAMSQDCAAARVRAQLAAVGGASADASPAATRSAAQDLMIEFDGDEARVAAKDRAALAALARHNRDAGRKVARIHAGRGGAGNVFEQAILAQQRARAVQDLLPKDVKATIDFDPELADDTVRIEFLQG